MDETTTTNAVTQDSGTQDVQPDEQQAEAVANTTDESKSIDQSDQTDTVDEPGNTDTSDDSEWLSKKGIDPTSPDAFKKVSEMARNAERAMHKNAQERADLQKQLTSSFENKADPSDPTQWMQGQVQELKLNNMARDFVDRHPDAKESLTDFSAYLKSNADLQTLTEAGVLTLDQTYAMFSSSPEHSEKLRAQGGQEALKKLANKQRASAVQGNASSSGTKTSGNSMAELESRLLNTKF